jgi:hypothetical protein
MNMPPRSFLKVAVILLVLAVLPLPYGYYQLLRLVVCGLGIWCALANWQEGQQSAAGMWGLLALTYNPLMPIAMGPVLWPIINLVSAVGVGVVLLRNEAR